MIQKIEFNIKSYKQKESTCNIFKYALTISKADQFLNFKIGLFYFVIKI